MAVKNSIAPRAEQKKTTEITYTANNEAVALSPEVIRQHLVSGGGNVTDTEVMTFLNLCRYQHLNPFLREAYLIKYGDRSPATMVVGKDVFLKRAKRRPEFDGLQAGVIVRNKETKEIEEREGTFFLQTEEALLGGWAKIWIKGFRVPMYASVRIGEYAGRKSDGSLNGQWASKPGTMIRKVAMVQALREAFPEDAAGLYDQDEIPQAQEVVLDEAAVIVAEPEKAEEVKQPEPVQTDDPEAALFG